MDKRVATRADLGAMEKNLSGRMESGFAELRRENKFTNRIGLGILIALFVFVAKFVIGTGE